MRFFPISEIGMINFTALSLNGLPIEFKKFYSTDLVRQQTKNVGMKQIALTLF